MKNWTQTDGSVESMQYHKKINEFTYLYREVDKVYKTEKEALEDFENWHEDEIDIRDYTTKEVVSAVETFGYDLKENYTLFQGGYTFSGDEAKMLIAECLFEYNHY